MRAGNKGRFVALLAGLVIGTLSAGCNKEPRQKAAERERSLAEQDASLAAPAKTDSTSDESQVVGDWQGESLVQVKNSAAKDEKVVWHVVRANEPDKVNVTADKIVNGRAITMGTLPFKYDKNKKTIVCEYEQGVWTLAVKGNKMEGTLTRPDQTVFRRVTLERVP
jgi:hypothetical protein